MKTFTNKNINQNIQTTQSIQGTQSNQSTQSNQNNQYENILTTTSITSISTTSSTNIKLIPEISKSSNSTSSFPLPFMLTAFLYSKAETKISKYSYLSKSVNIIGGVFLIIIGWLLLTENFGLTVVYGYKLFEIFNYDALYNYL